MEGVEAGPQTAVHEAAVSIEGPVQYMGPTALLSKMAHMQAVIRPPLTRTVSDHPWAPASAMTTSPEVHGKSGPISTAAFHRTTSKSLVAHSSSGV